MPFLSHCFVALKCVFSLPFCSCFCHLLRTYVTKYTTETICKNYNCFVDSKNHSKKFQKPLPKKRMPSATPTKNRLAKVQSKKLADSGLTEIIGWKCLSHIYYQPNSIPVSQNSVIITPEGQFSQILHRLYIRCSPTVQYNFTLLFSTTSVTLHYEY